MRTKTPLARGCGLARLKRAPLCSGTLSFTLGWRLLTGIDEQRFQPSVDARGTWCNRGYTLRLLSRQDREADFDVCKWSSPRIRRRYTFNKCNFFGYGS